MTNDSSKYNVFIDNYNQGFNQYLNNISGNFFERIDYDKSVIERKAPANSILANKISQIDRLKITNSNLDNYSRLKSTAKILLDITPDIAASGDEEIKRSGASIINNFFEVARQTEDEALLKIAADISTTANKPV